MRESGKSVWDQVFKLVANSRFATQKLPEGGIEEMANRLGVTVELLEEVRVKAGIVDKRWRERNTNPSFTLRTPPKILDIFRERVQEDHTTIKGLARSLVYLYMQDTWEPKYYDCWTIEGVRYTTNKNKGAILVHFPVAAYMTYKKRVAFKNSSMARTLRSLLMSYYYRELPWEFRVITKSQFSPREEDYVVG